MPNLGIILCHHDDGIILLDREALVLNRLHERGWISNPVSKAKSVIMTDEGARQSRELFERHFGGA